MNDFMVEQLSNGWLLNIYGTKTQGGSGRFLYHNKQQLIAKIHSLLNEEQQQEEFPKTGEAEQPTVQQTQTKNNESK